MSTYHARLKCLRKWQIPEPFLTALQLFTISTKIRQKFQSLGDDIDQIPWLMAGFICCLLMIPICWHFVAKALP